MRKDEPVEIVLLSSGHNALDQRVFDKEAVSLARYFTRVRVVAMHDGDETRSGVRITALKPYKSRPERFLVRPVQCFLAARGQGQRLLILQDAELLLWAPLVKLLTGWKIIYDAHEDFPQLIQSRTWIPLRLRKSLSQGIGMIEKGFTFACDGVIGATGVLTDYFHHRRRTAIYNLPSRDFIETAAGAALPPAQREYDIVHLGTLAEEGRLEFLCAIIDELLARRAKFRALIIGVRADQERELTERYPSHSVTVMGKIDYERVPELLGRSKIGVNIMPVLFPHLRCAVSVKLFEYMAAGCNVVTSFLPEVNRLLGDEGCAHILTISTPSIERFAEGIHRLLEDPASMAGHQSALMHLVTTRWNWDREEDKLVRFVSDILTDSRQHTIPPTRRDFHRMTDDREGGMHHG